MEQQTEKKSFWRKETYWTMTARWVIVAALSYYLFQFFVSQSTASGIAIGLVVLVIAVAIARSLCARTRRSKEQELFNLKMRFFKLLLYKFEKVYI